MCVCAGGVGRRSRGGKEVRERVGKEGGGVVGGIRRLGSGGSEGRRGEGGVLEGERKEWRGKIWDCCEGRRCGRVK